MILDRGPNWEYFPYPDKSLFIVDLPDQEEAEKRKFEAKGLHMNFVVGIRYLGGYLCPRGEL